MSSARSKWWAGRSTRHSVGRSLVVAAGMWLVFAFVLGPLVTSPVWAQDEGAVGEVIDPAVGTVAAEEPADVVPTPEVEKRGSGLVTMFRQGGWAMYPLLLCSLVGLAFTLERLYSFQRARTNTRLLMERILKSINDGDLDGALAICSNTRGPIAAILAAGLIKARENRGKDAIREAIESSGQIELSFLQRGLIVLASITNIAPLIGFLGTVSGMINAFAAIAEAEQVSAKLVAKGIQEALLTTATGLLVAIPFQIFHSYFVSRIDRYVVEMEEAAVDLVDALVERGLLKD